MNIVLWMGNEPNQCALANKIHQQFPLSAIVKETRVPKKKRSIKKYAEAFIERIFIPDLGNAWRSLQMGYKKEFPEWPSVQTFETQAINSEAVFAFTMDREPDLILVSGTALIKEKMLSLPVKIGIMNLHTGLSPYVKGGPNCTNWCLAEGHYHLIGNTIMWINKGIDTGDIITTDFVPLNSGDTLAQLHHRVMEHAHELYLQAVSLLFKGGLSSKKQDDIAAGKTYYSRDWTLSKKIAAVRNFRKMKEAINKNLVEHARKELTVVRSR